MQWMQLPQHHVYMRVCISTCLRQIQAIAVCHSFVIMHEGDEIAGSRQARIPQLAMNWLTMC